MLTLLLFIFSTDTAYAAVKDSEGRSVSHSPHFHDSSPDRYYESEGSVELPERQRIVSSGNDETTESAETREPTEERKIKGRRREGLVRAKGTNLIRSETAASPGASWRQLDTQYIDAKMTFPEAELPWWESWWSELIGSSK